MHAGTVVCRVSDEIVLVSDLSVQGMLQMMMKLCLFQICRCRRCCRWWWSCAYFRSVGAGDATDDDEVVLVSELSVQGMLQSEWWNSACFRTVGAGDAADDDEVVLVSELSVQEMLQMMMKLYLFQICRCRRCCRWWWSCACFRTVGAGDAADDDEVALVSELSVQEMLQMMMKLYLFQICRCRRCCRWWWSCACFRSVGAGDAADDDEVVLVLELSVQGMLQMMMKLRLFQNCRCRRCCRWWWSCGCFRTVGAGDAADDDEVVLVSEMSVQEMLQMMMKGEMSSEQVEKAISEKKQREELEKSESKSEITDKYDPEDPTTPKLPQQLNVWIGGISHVLRPRPTAFQVLDDWIDSVNAQVATQYSIKKHISYWALNLHLPTDLDLDSIRMDVEPASKTHLMSTGLIPKGR